MPVLCGYRPVKIEEREGQHSESVTKYRLNVTPSFCIWRTCGMNCTRFQARSSVSTNTMLGRLLPVEDDPAGAAATGRGGLAGAACSPAASRAALRCPKFGFAA